MSNDAKYSNTNIDELPPMLECDGCDVYSWTPERDGKGRPQQVHMVFPVTMSSPDSEPLRFCVAMRLKSRRAVDEIIAALVRHRDDVWPEGKQS
jgi:hypothetical protein